MGKQKKVTVSVPINIALIKYWGKRDEELMLPLNDSVSLSIDELRATTTISLVTDAAADSVCINGKEVDLGKQSRFARCFNEVRRLARKRKLDDADGDKTAPSIDGVKFVINSETNFPIEAGLASSAAGFAALAFAFGRLFHLDDTTVVRIARLGSGSACRSVLSGFVHWRAGAAADGSDCDCISLASADHWPELRAVVAVTSGDSKAMGSTRGMENTVETSTLLKHRVSNVVPDRVVRLRHAISSRDFATLANITMRDSNQLHSVCLDTHPPLMYLNEASWHLIGLVHALNDHFGATRVAYTFDAGPNCCLFAEVDFIPTLLACLLKYCPSSGSPTKILEKLDKSTAESAYLGRDSLFDLKSISAMTDAVQYLVVSTVGSGPKVVDM
uniref:Diphosphomevalonate decarboxylase n=1 Tax=Plectus sambesii TaxID=2011161 RepID=A0A914VRD7_9BILA